MLSTVKSCTFVLASTLLLPALAEAQGPPPQLFVTADRCIACHSGLFAPSGEDISIGYNWRSSMMANSARDPYWQAAVRREVLDHPEAQAAIEDKCSTCHMPMARFSSVTAGARGEVFAHLGVDAGNAPTPAAVLARDGVSCSVCHQIREDNFGEADSFTGGLVIDTKAAPNAREVFGPFQVDTGRTTIMRSASSFVPTQGEHMQRSEMCATCHTLYTHALNADGEVVGELPEQVPYLEWAHSEYRESRSCQSCHMPALEDSVAISSVLGEPRPAFSKHVFRGANFYMLRLLNRYRADQNVAALPQEMDAAVRRTVEFVPASTARLGVSSTRVAGSRLRVDVSVENLAGHKLPTAYPSRRVWIHLRVTDDRGEVIFESGALRPDGSIVGNDNDAEPTRFEPHYIEIDRPDQVQIYEPIMVDSEGSLTTGLLFGVRYVKDNRLLPRGFDKATAEEDVAVHGRAVEDPDFRGGGDGIRYLVDVDGSSGPLSVIAELRYQPIAYRWAHNLAAYEVTETDRFVGYYETTARHSALLVAGDSITVEDAALSTR